MSEVEKTTRSRYMGLRDVYLAIVTSNTETQYVTETPVKIGRAIKAKISDKWSIEKIRSDDGIEDTVELYEGTDVELEVNTLAPQDRKLLFGQMYEKGFLTKNKNDKAPEIAIGYRTKRVNGKYEFAWHYCGKFAEGNEDEFETMQDKVNTKTSTLKGSFYERNIDGNYQVLVDESNLAADATEAKAAIKDWFSKVQEPKTAAA